MSKANGWYGEMTCVDCKTTHAWYRAPDGNRYYCTGGVEVQKVLYITSEQRNEFLCNFCGGPEKPSIPLIVTLVKTPEFEQEMRAEIESLKQQVDKLNAELAAANKILFKTHNE